MKKFKILGLLTTKNHVMVYFRSPLDHMDRDLALAANFDKINSQEEVAQLALTLNRLVLAWESDRPIEKTEITKAEALYLRYERNSNYLLKI